MNMKKLDHLNMLSKLSDTEKAQYALDKYIKTETILNKLKIGFYIALIIGIFAFVFAVFYSTSTSLSENFKANKTERTGSSLSGVCESSSEEVYEDEETVPALSEKEKKEQQEYEAWIRKMKREREAYKRIMNE